MSHPVRRTLALRHPVCTMRLGLENIQMGSLSGAEHLLHQNADVRRLAQCEQKSHVEYKGKSKSKQANLRVACVRKHGLEILCGFKPAQPDQRCLKNYHRDNWLVAS